MRFAAGAAAPVQLDAVRLRQVLVNLGGNAVKFTERGEVILRLSRLGAGERLAQVRFEVADTGVGIAPENQATIFEEFAQEDASTTRRFGGTGLGLAISRQIVELMGGPACAGEQHAGRGLDLLIRTDAAACATRRRKRRRRRAA